MIPIIHRVNNPEELINIPQNCGVEVDIRFSESKLVLGHDLLEDKFDFTQYLNVYDHNLLVANIKESGTEMQTIDALNKAKVSNFFLLDTEFPYILQNYAEFGEFLCVRYSSYESIDSVEPFIGKIKWLWVDTYQDFELDKHTASIMKNFSICLVSPSRWNTKLPQGHFMDKFTDNNLTIEAIMVSQNESYDF